ncbi:VOC family protein [Qaidamihabitans albus]|uniref:VOC family protein n=1 Tax=Qaidamihabitans albus TaxID=2795733 RepID=UPI0018F26D8E|nr:VOC family protein [Qaidamihabitans albus]
MSAFDFGQPVGGLVQYAYTVDDVRAAMTAWTTRLGVGPWFVRGPFISPTARYRGDPTDVRLTLARTFSGHAMIELVQQHCASPSVYRELIDQRGHGFHHWGIGTHDLDTEVARYRDEGHEVAFSDTLPSGARVTYVDTTSVLPGMVELIEMSPKQEATYTRIYLASVGWDGTEAVREG